MKIRFLMLILIIFAIKMNAQECESCNKRTKYKFILLKTKGVNIDTTLVKTNGVYLNKYYRINLDKTEQDIYSFYRFFDNGKIYMSCGYCSLPSEKEFNDLNYGFYGEYRVENNQIIVEYYGSYVGYYLSYYKTENNKIIETNTSKRKLSGKVKLNNSYTNIEYEFYKCKLNTNSFW
jgi:hypothetical protein